MGAGAGAGAGAGVGVAEGGDAGTGFCVAPGASGRDWVGGRLAPGSAIEWDPAGGLGPGAEPGFGRAGTAFAGLTPRASARCCRLLLRVRPWTLAPRPRDGAAAGPAPSTLTVRPVTVTGSSWDPCPPPRLASRGPARAQARFVRRPAVRDALPVGTRSLLWTPVPGRLTAWPSRRLPAPRPTARQPCSPARADASVQAPARPDDLGPDLGSRAGAGSSVSGSGGSAAGWYPGVRGLPRTRAVQLGLRETWLPFQWVLLRARTTRCPARGTGRGDGARGRVARRTGWARTARSLAWAGIPRALLRGRMAGGTACTSVRRVPLPARSVRSPTRTLLLRVPTCAWTAQRRGRGPVSWGRTGTATAPRP